MISCVYTTMFLFVQVALDVALEDIVICLHETQVRGRDTAAACKLKSSRLVRKRRKRDREK